MTTPNNIPAMSPPETHDYLRQLGSQWKGKGIAIELGSWLGATAVPLLEGLVQAGYNKPFYCFDAWEANGEQVIKAQAQGLDIKFGQDLRPLFLANVQPIYSNVKAYKGRIPRMLFNYPRQLIEICLFDAPKKEPVFSDSIRILSRYWIPGVTVLGLLDYNFYKQQTDSEAIDKYRAPVRFMERHKSHFTVIKQWDSGHSEVFFRYIKKL